MEVPGLVSLGYENLERLIKAAILDSTRDNLLSRKGNSPWYDHQIVPSSCLFLREPLHLFSWEVRVQRLTA